MGSVRDIGLDTLVRRAVRSARCREYRRGTEHPRWVAVMDAFGLGSTYARELCVLCDVDPDETVKR
jgi:hypothetical protein